MMPSLDEIREKVGILRGGCLMQHACMIVFNHSQITPNLPNVVKKAFLVDLLRYTASMMNIVEDMEAKEFDDNVDYPITATLCKTIADHYLMDTPLDKSVLENAVAMYHGAAAILCGMSEMDITIDDFPSMN